MNLEDVIQRGTRIAQPVANTVPSGTIYFVTGENVLERSNGSAWESISAAVASSSSGISAGFALTLIGSEEPEIPIIIPGPAGATGATGAPGSSGSAARITLSSAQIVTLSSAPVTILAAQGADKIIVPLNLSAEIDTTTLFSNNPTWSLFYNGGAVALMIGTLAPGINSVQKRFVTAYDAQYSLTYSTFDPRNKSVVLKASVDATGAGAATAVVNLIYAVVQVT